MKRILKSNESIYIFYRKLRMSIVRIRYGLKHVSKTFYLAGKSEISKDLIADDYAYIGSNCMIGPKVKIGRYTMLANNVSIVGGDHIYSNPNNPMIFAGRPEMPVTIIGEDAWIGAFSIIIAGVTIGDGAIVGAGSVVTKDIPPYAIHAGVPARFIKMRFDESEIKIHQAMLKQKSIEVKYCKDKI